MRIGIAESRRGMSVLGCSTRAPNVASSSATPYVICFNGHVLDDLRVRGHDSWHIGPDLHLLGIECLTCKLAVCPNRLGQGSWCDLLRQRR